MKAAIIFEKETPESDKIVKAFKGKKIKMIFNEDSRGYFEEYPFKENIEARFLKQTTPAEINIFQNKTIIVLHSTIPIAILIQNQEIGDSFKEYFKTMWKIASP